MRIIDHQKYRAHTSELFKKLKILKCREIYKYQIGQFIYKHKENILPPLFSYLFRFQSDIHGYNTRQRNHYVAWDFDIDLTKRSIRYEGILFWNSLSNVIKDCVSVDAFKQSFKKHLLLKQE